MDDSRRDRSLPACVVNCAVYDRAGHRRDISLDAISDVLATDDGSFVWVGLYEPEDALLDKLKEEFGLHDLSVEDAHVHFGETHLCVGAHFLITVRHGASESYAQVRKRFEREPEMLALGPIAALYGILDFVVDNYEPIVEDFRHALDSLEHEVFAETYRRDTIVHLYELKKELTQMRLAVAPVQDIVAQVTRTPVLPFNEEAKLYLRDVQDHAVRLNESIDTLREMLTAAMSVNMSLAAIGQGEIVKKLAGWAGLLAVPTLVASWYGMNFRHMPELDHPHAYPVLIGTVLVACIVLYRYLRKVRWL
jgi:magnesium transporter